MKQTLPLIRRIVRDAGLTGPGGVLPQSELESTFVRVSADNPYGGLFHDYVPSPFHRPGEGRRSPPPPPGEDARLRPRRPARHQPHPLLPLAEGVLRERPGGL